MDSYVEAKPLIGTRARPGVLVIGLVAAGMLGALLGLVFGQAAASMRTPAAAGAEPALYVQTTTWTAPDASAPGTQRLFLETVVSNPGRASVSVAPQTFAVRASDGRTWTVAPSTAAGSQPAASLRPGEQRSLDLFADLPAGVSGLRLTWTHQGLSDSVPVL